MSGDYRQFEQRKQDHIKLALMQSNQASEMNGLDGVQLVHEALPDLDFDTIDISSTRFGQRVKSPFMVASMTAGHDDALRLNRNLMAACAKTGWAMGVGSQRRELTDNSASHVWTTLREAFPNIILFGNLGIAQLITTPIKDVLKLTERLQASALIVHTNPLQECIQPEGTVRFKGSWDALKALVEASSIPVIVKETGCGFSKATLKRLNTIGVAAVDVSGLGGTHWGRIEGHRASHEPRLQHAAQTFQNWGITTPMSVCYAKVLEPSFEVWGSGGIRHGLDAAKIIALGASTVSFAKPMLEAALQSEEQVVQVMQTFEYELQVALFCTGSSDLNALKEKVRC